MVIKPSFFFSHELRLLQGLYLSRVFVNRDICWWSKQTAQPSQCLYDRLGFFVFYHLEMGYPGIQTTKESYVYFGCVLVSLPFLFLRTIHGPDSSKQHTLNRLLGIMALVLRLSLTLLPLALSVSDNLAFPLHPIRQELSFPNPRS